MTADPSTPARQRQRTSSPDASGVSRVAGVGAAATWGIAALLVVLTAIVYAPIVHNEFVGIDTGSYLTENPDVRAGLTAKSLAWAWTTFHASNWHPLTWWSHMLDVELFGLRPVAHHVVNVAFHACNGVLVFLVLRALTGRVAASFVVAALFVVHPLHVESVAWIVERKDVLSTFFGLAAVWAWIPFARRGSRVAYASALVLFAASLAAKPMLVTLPFVLLVLDAWPLSRASSGWWRLAREKWPFFVLTAASCVVTWFAQRAGGAVQGLEHLSIGDRLANAVASYAWYLVKAFWPAGSSFHYALDGATQDGWKVLGALFVVVAFALAWWQRRERPWIAAGLALFGGTLVPVIGLVQVGGQAHADRYTYVPLLGVFVAVVWTLDAWIVGSRVADNTTVGERVVGERPASSSATRAIATGAIVLVAVVVLGASAHDRVGAWKDSETLARRALAVDERSAVAHDLLGWTLVETNRLYEGLPHLARAVELSPGDPEARRNYGRALVRAGRVGQAEVQLRTAASIRPTDLIVLTELASVCQLQGNWSDARATFMRVLELEPRLVEAHAGLGEVLERLGEPLGARREYMMALALDPRNARANVDFARMNLDDGNVDAAEPLLRRVLTADPEHPQALQQRARVAVARRDYVGAVRDLRAAVEARPSWPLAMADLAWWLACAPDPAARDAAESLKLAEGAVALGNEQEASYVDVLAAAYAANARFPDAATFAARAVELARRRGDLALAGRIEKRRAAYEAGIMDIGTPR